jgi:hypothetical protein
MFNFFKKKPKVEVNYHLLNNSVVLNFYGKTIAVSKDDSRYNAVLECIKNKDLESIPGIVDTEKAFEGTGIELRDGLLYAGSEPMPSELNARILNHKALGLPYDSLLKFWENLRLNPSYNARQQLFAFLSHNGHPLTEDGYFIAYRGVREDFKDVHTGTFDNKVGSVCEMPREHVDDNPNNTCSRGLHVACYEYAKGFGVKLVEVKVNPRDVVAVPVDYNGTKMRTCRFEVVALGEKLRDEAVYGKSATSAEVTVKPVEISLKGYPDNSEGEDDESDENHCSECESERDPWHSFCPECGHEFKF